MARPKRDINEISAEERIENAFWELLEKRDYADITISSLAKTAHVNHNMIYYYYENMDDLARKAFQKNIDTELPQQIFSMFMSGAGNVMDLVNQPETMKRWKRLRLYVKGDSAFLMGIFQTNIKKKWLSYMGKTQDMLSKKHKLELDFILSGVTMMLGKIDIYEEKENIVEVLDGELGKGLISTMKSIKGEDCEVN